MISITKDNKISITQHDNAILNFSLEGNTLTDGDEVYFLVKKSFSQTTYDMEIVTNTFVDGVARIFIPCEATRIEPNTYNYAICVHTKDGVVSTVISGKLIIVEGVHHAE